ncbi:hypothetical protein [Hoeflea prorocentri]|uniref:Uncharacterized protein n=1 Tax=Hoeflea prorocentri TaxID=1922333 RepID=A0A9X3ZIF9_9HYPH|nr:hypothetical protein [Hoeflea prorocentri]MCY6381690.1 hypothetical protein [Hoeflea prorocentri]MDA5399490.1 hypothetical protein [Hoeflea prorocentri]
MWLKTIKCSAIALGVGLCMGSNAYADQEYDSTIEQAAIKIVMRKLGPIRGTHEINEPFSLYPPAKARSVQDGTLIQERRVRVILQ